MPREGPAVVQRPIRALIARGKPGKEHLVVEVVAVQVVQVHHMRIKLVQRAQQAPRGCLRVEARLPIETRKRGINVRIHPRAIVELMGITRGTAPAPQHPRLIAQRQTLLVYLTHNGARGAVGYAVYLHISHARGFRHTTSFTMGVNDWMMRATLDETFSLA